MTQDNFHGHYVRSIFSSIAHRYQMFNHVSSFGQDRRWLKRLAHLANVQPGEDVLDIAAGTGEVSYTLLKHQPHIASIEITDFCPDMLQIAQLRYMHEITHKIKDCSAHVSFRELDAHHLPYHDESFSVITTAYGLRNFSDRLQAMREAYRVCKPGGRYIVLEFSTPPHKLWRQAYELYRDNIMPTVGAALTHDKDGFTYLAQSIKAFPSQQQLVKELESIGFKGVFYQNLSGGIVALYCARKPKNCPQKTCQTCHECDN